MTNKAFKTAMPRGWRIAALLAALIGGVLGALAVNQARPEAGFDLVLSMIVGLVSAGMAGGAIVVLWFIYRAFCPASADDDVDADSDDE